MIDVNIGGRRSLPPQTNLRAPALLRPLLRFPGGNKPLGGLSEVVQLLARFRIRLLIVAFLGLCAGVIISLLMTPRYQARVALEIQNPNVDFLSARSVNSVAEASAADNGNLTDVATEIKIMESDQLLDRVIAKLRANGEGGRLQAAAGHRSFLSRILRRKVPTADVVTDRTRKLARQSLSIKQIGPTRAVELLYTSEDPRFAAQFANAMAVEYIDLSEESRWNKSRHTEESLSHELDEVRSRLQASQNALQRYAASSGLLFVNGQHAAADASDISESKLSQLQTALSEAANERMAAQSHYETAATSNPEDLGDVLSDQRLRDLNERLTDLKRQRAELTTTYTEENDRVRRVVAQIAPLEADFQNRRASILGRIDQDYHTARRKEGLLQESYNDQVKVVEGKEADSVQYGILKQDVASNQSLYESVLEEVKRAGIASAVRSNNIEIFDPARPPVEPYSPRPALMGGAGFLAGLFAACLFTLFTESKEHTLQGAGELQGWLDLPELGVIPTKHSPRALRINVTTPKAEIGLITCSDTRSAEYDAYRALLTSILYSNNNGGSLRTIVLTSANPNEGKTTTTCNLGILMAELNRRTLLIDADFRRPRLHSIFGVSSQYGFSDILEDVVNFNPSKAVIQTFVPNLFLLPSGGSNVRITRLLHSEPLSMLLQKLYSSFDSILIDTSPSLFTADARILGRSADAVLLITRAGYTTHDEVERAAKIFTADGTRVLGTVLNDVKVPRSKYYYSA